MFFARNRSIDVLLLAVSLAFSWVLPAAANPYDPNAVTPAPNIADGVDVPDPIQVFGKQFSDNRDRDALGAADPGQEVRWDGAGGTADGNDYSISNPLVGEVDAIANNNDAFFSSLHQNKTGLLFSTTGDANVYFERSDGSFGVWATPSTIDAMNAPNDVDGLEIWGPENASDADRYSLDGDPGVPGAPRVAVWGYDAGLDASTALVLNSTIGSVIGLPDALWDQVDLDALMVNPSDTGGQSLIFSIDPIRNPTNGSFIFDGGEIWHWDGISVAADFLEHGGHKWDTAFDVMGTFGLDSENINAIEAGSVPEPGTALLLLAGLTLAAMRKRAA